jgi:D-tyrosyl-tRNA(Tyr) deacylase
MRCVIQRVSEASVQIDGTLKSSIGKGLLVLVGFEVNDNSEDLTWMANKIINMRIFHDEAGLMNKSLLEVDGNLLIVSQFTLHASTKKGNRPSFIAAARPEQAIPLYESFLALCSSLSGKEVQSGTFGADMKVGLINDGPVTIVVDSKQKE